MMALICVPLRGLGLALWFRKLQTLAQVNSATLLGSLPL
jgi:hypothetical protein